VLIACICYSRKIPWSAQSVMQSWGRVFDDADLIEPAGTKKRERQFAAGHA